MDDCDEILTFGLAHVSHMSSFNGFDQTDRNEFHGRIIDQFLMITVDSAPADNHESTLGTGTNDLGERYQGSDNPVLWQSRGSLWIVWQLH